MSDTPRTEAAMGDYAAIVECCRMLERELAEVRRYLLLTLEQGNDILPQDVQRAYVLCGLQPKARQTHSRLECAGDWRHCALTYCQSWMKCACNENGPSTGESSTKRLDANSGSGEDGPPNAAPDAERPSGREVPSAAPVAAPFSEMGKVIAAGIRAELAERETAAPVAAPCIMVTCRYPIKCEHQKRCEYDYRSSKDSQ